MDDGIGERDGMDMLAFAPPPPKGKTTEEQSKGEREKQPAIFFSRWPLVCYRALNGERI